MPDFVKKDSIVREIWGNGDTILFIFAGASAEFALNKAVDWLYFTGKLPADPMGRLFSTVAYARQIVFSSQEDAFKAINQITAIHAGVEQKRGTKIPDWAYRDVLFMLIAYSISSFEVLERKLSAHEKEEVFSVFNALGQRMHIPDLATNYQQWLVQRENHLQNDLLASNFTADLFLQYHKHLGFIRFQLLLQAQHLVCPERVKNLLKFKSIIWLKPILFVYKMARLIRIHRPFKNAILPGNYRNQIKDLDVQSG
ncbi:MAG: DUF2236 domain-containing protein [Sphingobacteriales bacterium]|nr:DUF2236 domain-containing protein [Sphingobacteriales bacterium]